MGLLPHCTQSYFPVSDECKILVNILFHENPHWKILEKLIHIDFT
jgi:hypothetical protein